MCFYKFKINEVVFFERTLIQKLSFNFMNKVFSNMMVFLMAWITSAGSHIIKNKNGKQQN